MRRPRQNHSAAFKAKVVLAALKEEATLAGLAGRIDVHANQIIQWKSQLLENAFEIFASHNEKQAPVVDLKALHAEIGQ